MKHAYLLALTVGLLAASPAWAAPLSQKEAAQAALVASPAIQALDKAIDAARARAQAAGSWTNPSLVSQVQLSTDSGNNMLTLGFKQPLDFRGLADQRRAYAEEEVASLQYSLAQTKQKVANQARSAYVTLWLAEATLQAHDRMVAFVEGELVRGKKRVDQGVLAAHELVHTEFELAQARLRRQAAAHEAARGRSRLNMLWGRPTDAPVSLPPVNTALPALGHLETWQEEGRTQRPELGQAAVAIRRELRAAKLAESLRFGEGEVDLEAGTAGNYSPMVYGSFALPVPVWNNRQQEAIAARAESARFEAEKQLMAQEIAQEIADAYLGVQQAIERFREADTGLMPLAEHALEKAQARLKVGAGHPTDLLEARQEYLEAESARLKALLEVHQAYVRLEQAAGR